MSPLYQEVAIPLPLEEVLPEHEDKKETSQESTVIIIDISEDSYNRIQL